MRIAVVGAGPVGLYLGLALARQGRAVTVVDRDPGPGRDGWLRRGVMQFEHPHGFRAQVREVLLEALPDVPDALLAAGARLSTWPGDPGRVVGMQCRRSTFERVLRAAARTEAGLDLRTGHVDTVVVERGRVRGLRVDGALLEADVVLDASGRAGAATRSLARAGAASDCGLAYVSRQYCLLPGAAPGPDASALGVVAGRRGHLAIVFPHDGGTFSVLVSHASTDRSLPGLRTTAGFEAAARAVPALASWTRPDRARPLTPVLPGGRLQNSFWRQCDQDGRPAPLGLVFVGDTVCTTNPTAGRGVATGLLQGRELVRLLTAHEGDPAACAAAFDGWCERSIRPWYDDHLHDDAQLLRRWAGQDVDLSAPLPSSLVVAAVAQAPELMRTVGPYLGMSALPATLAAAQTRAREVYATGWRPPEPAGPTHAELVEVVAAASRAAPV